MIKAVKKHAVRAQTHSWDLSKRGLGINNEASVSNAITDQRSQTDLIQSRDSLG